MKKTILAVSVSALALVLTSSCNQTKTTEAGIEYTIIEHEDDSRMIDSADIVLVNLQITTEKSDSLIMESYSDSAGGPRYIPAYEPVLKTVFAELSKGDSAMFWVNADTLFQKSFGVPRPTNMAEGERVKFVVTIKDVFSQAELQQKQMQQMSGMISQDSIALQTFLASQQNVQTTASGLHYIVKKKTNGKQTKAGNKVQVMYEGRLLTGDVFDGNMDGSRPPQEFAIGLGQVIPGWDEGVQLMREGEEYTFIIPWKLAYGERGAGPIPPFSSLVFDVKLVKIQ